MLKALFIAVSTLAIAHILALAGFAAWLHQGDRLNMARINEIRDIFATTITADEAALAQEARQAAEEQAAAEAAAIEANPPLPTANRMSRIGEFDDLNFVTVERLRKEGEDLGNTMARQLAAIGAAREELEAERAEFEQQRADIRATEGSTQFKKALQRYEALKPDAARAVFEELIEQGGTDQVVAYLNAMQPRGSSKIIGKFPPEVAADLLERIRKRGVETVASAAPTAAPE